MLAICMGAVVLALQEPAAGAQLRAWSVSADGEFRGDRGSLEGTTLDLEDDLGLGGPETLVELGAFVRLGNAGRLRAGYWGGDFEGHETLTRTVRFLGLTYTVSTAVESEARLDVGSFAYELPASAWAGLEPSAVEVGVLLGAKVAGLEIDVRSDAQSASEAYTAAFPTLGLRAEVRPWPWLLGEVEGAFSAFSYDGVSVRYAEARMELRARPWPSVSAGLGYRFVRAEVDDEDDFDLEVDLGGPLLVLAVAF
jgi:hypothetical protein